MASSALRRALLQSRSVRGAFRSNQPLPASAAAGSTFHRSFQSRDDETLNEFEKRLFGNSGSDEGALFRKLDKVGNAGRRYGMGSGMGSFGGFGNQSREGFDSLNDGMSGMLSDAARNFQADDEEENEMDQDDFEFRPDVQFRRGSMYNVRDLDLTRPAAAKNPPRPQFETTTKEVLKKADFRNVRFLSNFITEAGIIIKRSQTRISAKAQRKLAREIKTARAFGLMPFTTMGRKPFIFGRTAEEHHPEEESGYDFVKPDGEADEEDAEPSMDPA